MMAGIDLHIHTSVSDGRFTPEEIVHRAIEAGLSVIAITDHDNVGGIAPALAAAAAFPQLRVIPGVEISSDVPDGEAHVLGYCLDYTDQKLLETVERMRSSRVTRARKMVARLAELGKPVDWERVLEFAGEGSIGRPHIAQALLENGHVRSLEEAFDSYLGRNGPAYVERDKMTPVEAVGLILAADGLPVLAHPMTVADPEAMIGELQAAGLIGIEVYYAGHSVTTVQRLAALAARTGLIPTGGTDYHGLDDASAGTETPLGQVNVPPESVERLLALAQRRHSGRRGSKAESKWTR